MRKECVVEAACVVAYSSIRDAYGRPVKRTMYEAPVIYAAHGKIDRLCSLMYDRQSDVNAIYVVA